MSRSANGTAAGAVFVYDTSIVTAEEPEQPEAPSALSLSVYSNPVRNEAEIRIRLVEPEDVRVALYDVLGREVAVVHDGVLPAGERRLALNTSELAQGVYVVRVQGDRVRLSRPLTAVR